MDTAIRIENLVKNYAKFSLNHVNLTIPKGCIMGLVGENGAGKTTLIKCILGLIHINEGNIFVQERNVKQLDAKWKDEVGIVMAEANLHENLNAVQVGKIMENIYTNWENEVYAKYLSDFRIDAKKNIKDYSRGMKMKLQIAIALSHKANLLIFDEATSGLDPVVRDEILEILLEFIQDSERTVILSSHITSDLEKVADYITFLHEGSIVFSENKDELIYNYGIVKCTPKEYTGIDRAHIKGVRKNQFGYEVMIDNRMDFMKKNKELVVDATTIEEIILFKVKGEAA